MTQVGKLSEIWRFPVKSMAGERLDRAEVTAAGLVGDRGRALIDSETGHVVSAKSARRFPDILFYSAAYAAPPAPGAPLPEVIITCPDGSCFSSEDPGIDAALSARLGRAVRLVATAPEAFTIDQFHPDLDGAAGAGSSEPQMLGAGLFGLLGMAPAVPAGSFFDLYPLTLLTNASLDHFGALAPQSAFAAERFRMNLTIATPLTGPAEDAWPGRTLTIGAVTLHIAPPTPRCVITTAAQPGLAADVGVLRTLARHNLRRVVIGAVDIGERPCLGVYAEVTATGTIGTGDPVTLA